ncbi:MAG: cytochrome P450 [Prochloraceae cyanobacterium]|nr:cytochrome P450 [Prochloraceae cyanobacterium]
MTFDISSNLLIGSSPGEINDRLFQWFLEVSKGLFAFPLPWRWTPFGKALEAREKILAYIETAMAERELSPKEDVLTLLMQVKDDRAQGLTASEIKSQTLALLLGSIANTASMLTCTCMALAQNPDILTKARIEQQEIGIEEPLRLEHLKHMTYLEQILKEVERRYPPVGAGFRRVVKPFVFQDYYVPQDWNMMYSIIGTHNDSRIYPEPKRFDPERFSPENIGNKLTDFNLIGFGGGNRNCIGIAFAKTLIKVFASYLIRHYNWELLPKQDLTLNPIPVLCPRSGLKVKLNKL